MIYVSRFVRVSIAEHLLFSIQFYNSSGGGVTVSGGECLIQADFCKELLMKLKTEKINTAVDTCGFIPRKNIDKVAPYTDIFLYDIKAYDEDIHVKCTGYSNKIILENLKYIDELGKSIEIRIPYVPEYNDGEMEKIAVFLSDINNITAIKVLQYHNLAGSKYESLGMKNNLPKRLPTADEMENAVNTIRAITGKKVY